MDLHPASQEPRMVEPTKSPLASESQISRDPET